MLSWLCRSTPRVEPLQGPQKWLPAINRDYCTGCGICWQTCPEQSIQMIWSFATVTCGETCTSCEQCVQVCPDGLIEMRWLPCQGDSEVGTWRGD
jgi:Pyruvate/2-oxoacid:ferredoxin oxidoreductase delta subunit